MSDVADPKPLDEMLSTWLPNMELWLPDLMLLLKQMEADSRSDNAYFLLRGEQLTLTLAALAFATGVLTKHVATKSEHNERT